MMRQTENNILPIITGHLMGQYCFARWRRLSYVVVYRRRRL